MFLSFILSTFTKQYFGIKDETTINHIKAITL